MSIRPPYPFTALHGQEVLQTALVLTAIDPLIGGLLIEGPRGMAKSTSARALAELLPGSAFVNLPLGCSEEQLTGSLDLADALQNGHVNFRPGLLSRANEGVLYVDEVNLLPDPLVDTLLDVCASGVNIVEREGISHSHASRFVLIGTMNAEEGELRPQLLDRFGLHVKLDSHLPPALRQQIVRSRLQYDSDPAAFAAQHAERQQALKQRIFSARVRTAQLQFEEDMYELVSELCHAAHIDGVRGDLVLLRAARAHAALHDAERIGAQDVYAVQELVLQHRRNAREAGHERNEGRQDIPTQTAVTSPPQRNDGHWGAMPPEVIQAPRLANPLPVQVKKY